MTITGSAANELLNDNSRKGTNVSSNSLPQHMQCASSWKRDSAVERHREELKSTTPALWSDSLIYYWLLDVCHKHNKVEGNAHITLPSRLYPFVSNFQSGNFHELDPELRDIITAEHRKLFDNVELVDLDSVDTERELIECLSPVPSNQGHLGGAQIHSGPWSIGVTDQLEAGYTSSNSPDSGSEHISNHGSPRSFIEQQPPQFNPSPSQPPPQIHPEDFAWSQPSHLHQIPHWLNTPIPQEPSFLPPPASAHMPHLQHMPIMDLRDPHMQFIQFPGPIPSQPTFSMEPPPLHCPPLDTVSQPRRQPKRNRSTSGLKRKSRNVTDTVVNPKILETMPSSVQLWEFVLKVLKHPDYNCIISWENQHDGIFHIHDPQALAELWGKHRNHDGMNYDKMSRAMRYYYRRGILEPVRERLTYKFSSRLRGMFYE